MVESDLDDRDTDDETVKCLGVDVDVSIINSDEELPKKPLRKRKINDSFEDRLINILKDRKSVDDPVT